MDDFREWLSDNLRYFELGGAILLVVLLIFFGISSCVGGKSEKTPANNTADTSGETVQIADDGTGEETSNTEDSLTEADEDISSLIRRYYQALSDKDAEGVRAVVSELSPTDEPVITNSSFENYQVEQVYMKKGLTDDARFVLASYSYQCAGIATPVPVASTFYVQKDADGSWKIDTDAGSDPDISAFMNAQMSDAQVQSITAQVKEKYNSALASDPELSAFLNGVGTTETPSQEDSSSAQTSTEDDGPKVMATTVVNVRDMAGGDDSEVIGELDEGEVVSKLGTEGDWTMISYNGETAYVYSEYLVSAGD